MERIKQILRNGLRKVKKSLKPKASFSLLLILSFLLSNAVFSAPEAQACPPPDHKITICHATHAHQNPYVEINVSKSSIKAGHDIHDGPIWYEGIDESWGDIIPPFKGYSGKNWNEQGQEIWGNGCQIPAVEEPITYHTVTFMDGDDTYATSSVADGQSLGQDMPADPEKQGYTFEGWSADPQATVANFDSDTLVNQDITVYAIWQEVEEPEEPVISVIAHKIVCEDESYLPNWGAVRAHGNPIDENTVQDFLSKVNACKEKDVCWLASNWYFEWANKGISNPGDNIIGPAGGSWNAFSPTDSTGKATTVIESITGDYVWLREVMKEGYVPFSGTTAAPHNNVSAEFYCHIDVLNYDNYDRIDNPQLGQTYYCVAFNALIEPITYHTVTFMDGDDTYATSSVADGQSLGQDMPADPEKQGYTFEGWSADPQATVADFDSDTPVNQDITVYAIWQEVEEPITYHTVTFEGNGGTPTSTEVEVGEGETVDSLPAVTKDGYNFIEWNTQSNGQGDEFTSSTVVTSDITVYAIWQEKETPPPAPKIYIGGGGGFTWPEEPAVETEGEVLGEEAVAECGLYLYEYIKYGAKNNPQEVKKLQIFLNFHMGENLAITGIYDLASMEAVNRFQLRYKEQVLRPWVEEGLHTSENIPTGYVYKTTQRWINILMCPILNLAMPDFSEDRIRLLGLGYQQDGMVLGEETDELWLDPEFFWPQEDETDVSESPEPIWSQELEDLPEIEFSEQEQERKPALTILAIVAGLLALGVLLFYLLGKRRRY